MAYLNKANNAHCLFNLNKIPFHRVHIGTHNTQEGKEWMRLFQFFHVPLPSQVEPNYYGLIRGSPKVSL